jgi:hypothetical protein
MKKYPTGFVPVNYHDVGKILFVIGLSLLFLKGIDPLFIPGDLPDEIAYLGLISLITSTYLILFVPKPE